MLQTLNNDAAILKVNEQPIYIKRIDAVLKANNVVYTINRIGSMISSAF
jgi:glutamate-1-semialdehyde 2,1-aminomutase